MLNLLVSFRSGKLQLLLNADYSRVYRQLDDKMKLGVITEVEVLPSGMQDCKNQLTEMGVLKSVT